MNLADGKISKRQWFRMSYLECVTISMMMIPYITLSLAGKYHVLALVVGLAFVVLYGALMLYLADFVPCGYINAIRNHMGWTAGILDVLYALRYLLRATLIAVFFSMILQRYLLQSFSVWWIFLPFLGITLYGASKSMEGRARMFEFLFGWMVVPLILIVVFSVSNIDIGAIMQGITSQSEVSGVFKGAYAILLALSPLELQLYSRPCVKEKDRMGGIWLLVWILFTIVFAYLFIVAILGYGWTASDTTASFNVMEAASFPGGGGGRHRQLASACAPSAGKTYIHTGGKVTDQHILWENCAEQDTFLEAMADAASTVAKHFAGKIAYVAIMKNLSVDCDCCAVAEDPCMNDVGILSSLDPVALDRACIDLVMNSNDPGRDHFMERVNSRHGTHTIDAAETLGIGTQAYELVKV